MVGSFRLTVKDRLKGGDCQDERGEEQPLRRAAGSATRYAGQKRAGSGPNEDEHESSKEEEQDMVSMMNTALMRIHTAVSGLKARLTEERGQDLLEYALLGGLLAAAITAAAVVLVMTGAVSGMATGIAECIDFNSATVCL